MKDAIPFELDLPQATNGPEFRAVCDRWWDEQSAAERQILGRPTGQTQRNQSPLNPGRFNPHSG